MDIFTKLSVEDRRAFFETTADKANIVPTIVEKDFWVCWTLKILFGMKDISDHLIFKGGTSLSKVYRVIERFSEDLDVSIDKAFLGFDGEKDPEKMACFIIPRASPIRAVPTFSKP